MERLYDERELAKLTGTSVKKWQLDRLKGSGPPFVKLGRLVRYRESDLMAWMDSQTFHSTTDASQAPA